MNATISPGADSAFAATIRSCTKKPSRFARPYARKLWVWLKKQGAGVIDLGVLGRGRMVYEFEPDGPFVKLTIRDDPDYGFDPKKEGVDDCSDCDQAVEEAIENSNHKGMEVQP